VIDDLIKQGKVLGSRVDAGVGVAVKVPTLMCAIDVSG
jgi:hypothetical protein